MSQLNPAVRPVRIFKRAVFRALHQWREPHLVHARIGSVTLAVPSRNKLAEEIYANAFERVERGILQAVVRPGTTVVDVGANIGFYSCLFGAAVGPRGRVLAFEPTPSSHELLRLNVGRNGLQNIEILELALSDRQGMATFNVFADDAAAYNSLGASAAYGTAAVAQINVQTARLDDFLDRIVIDDLSAVKIDVEGAEELVIAGGRALLDRASKAILMVELNEAAARQCGSTVTRVVSALAELGYAGFVLNGRHSLMPLTPSALQRLVEMRSTHNDVFFARPPGVALLHERSVNTR